MTDIEDGYYELHAEVERLKTAIDELRVILKPLPMIRDQSVYLNREREANEVLRRLDDEERK